MVEKRFKKLIRLKLFSYQRDAMLIGDSSTLDNGRHLFAKSYEPSSSNKSRSFAATPNFNTSDHNMSDKSRSGSVTPDGRLSDRRRRISYAGHSKVCNYGYIGETRERMFDILINSQKAMSRKVSYL